MAVTYYYGDPRLFRGYASTLRDENSLLDYWFYPNRAYMEEVRKENQKLEDENKKKDGKGKGGGGGGGEGGGGGKKKDKDGDQHKEGEGKGGDNKKGGKDDNKSKVIELKVPLCCEACARKVKKKLEKLEGVERGGVVTDMYENRVTVKATVKEDVVLKQAQKVKREAQLWPKKKEPDQKKKGDNKGGDGNKGGGGGGGGGDNKNKNKKNHDHDHDED